MSEFIFITVSRLSCRFLRIVRRSSIHRLKFGFVKIFFTPIGFICFTTLNAIYLRRYVRDVVELKCILKWVGKWVRFLAVLEQT